MSDDYDRGSISALEAFRAELIRHRGHIENEDEPVFDVIVGLLELTLTGLRAMNGEGAR